MRQLDNGDESGSHASFTKAVSVTNKMIRKFMAVLRRMDVTFYVAPYEADAQLAFLSRQKLIDAVVSEDSDCVPYGCRTVGAPSCQASSSAQTWRSSTHTCDTCMLRRFSSSGRPRGGRAS